MTLRLWAIHNSIKIFSVKYSLIKNPLNLQISLIFIHILLQLPMKMRSSLPFLGEKKRICWCLWHKFQATKIWKLNNLLLLFFHTLNQFSGELMLESLQTERILLTFVQIWAKSWCQLNCCYFRHLVIWVRVSLEV